MNLNQLAQFCRRMGTGLRAGIDILRLLESEKKSGDALHRRIMDDMIARIRKGETLAESMKAHEKHFPNLLVQMVKASETGGRMESTFAYMSQYYEQLKKTRSTFLRRIAWPLIQLGIAVGLIGLVILIQAVITPNTQYDASALGLRGYRGFFMYCLIVTLLFGTLAITAFGVVKNWFQCHRWLMPLVQRVPKVGAALTTLGLSRLSMTLSMLLNAGVDPRHAIKQAFWATGNDYFISGMKPAMDEVARGGTFGDAFEMSGVLPIDFVDAIRVGEISGNETETLDYLASDYQQRAEDALNFLAHVASISVWLGILVLLAFMVIRMMMQYINFLNDVIENPMG